MSGPYASFIWSAYGASAVVIVGLVLRAFVDHRAQVAALRRLDPGAASDGLADG